MLSTVHFWGAPIHGHYCSSNCLSSLFVSLVKEVWPQEIKMIKVSDSVVLDRGRSVK
nr:hypothetical protein Q903MT_gene3541 [Picea sitchensis]